MFGFVILVAAGMLVGDQFVNDGEGVVQPLNEFFEEKITDDLLGATPDQKYGFGNQTVDEYGKPK